MAEQETLHEKLCREVSREMEEYRDGAYIKHSDAEGQLYSFALKIAQLTKEHNGDA